MTQQMTIDFDQQANLTRVSGRIAGIVLDFLRAHVGQQFHLSELQTYCQARAPGSPTSPDRVMRDLKRRGLCSYRVLSRSDSLYECLEAAGA